MHTYCTHMYIFSLTNRQFKQTFKATVGCTFKFIQLHHRELEWSYVVYDVWHVVDLTDILYSLSTIVIFEWKLQWKLFTWKLWNIPQIKYVSIKFIALYIYSIFKNTKISNNYLMKHEIILQIFISTNSKFHQLIKYDDRFVYYIILTLYLIALYRSLLGFQVKLLPYLILLCISTSPVSLSRTDATFAKW